MWSIWVRAQQRKHELLVSLFEPSGDLISDFSQGGEKRAEHVTRRPVFWLWFWNNVLSNSKQNRGHMRYQLGLFVPVWRIGDRDQKKRHGWWSLIFENREKDIVDFGAHCHSHPVFAFIFVMKRRRSGPDMFWMPRDFDIFAFRLTETGTMNWSLRLLKQDKKPMCLNIAHFDRRVEAVIERGQRNGGAWSSFIYAVSSNSRQNSKYPTWGWTFEIHSMEIKEIESIRTDIRCLCADFWQPRKIYNRFNGRTNEYTHAVGQNSKADTVRLHVNFWIPEEQTSTAAGYVLTAEKTWLIWCGKRFWVYICAVRRADPTSADTVWILWSRKANINSIKVLFDSRGKQLI